MDSVTPGVQQLTRTYGSALLLLTPLIDPGPADDELDALLEDVLLALEGAAAGVLWERAERAVYQDTTPAYVITITVHTTHTRE